MSPALNRGLRKGLRTLGQLAVGGALTAAVNVFTDGLTANNKVLVMTAWTVVIAMMQNAAEAAGKVPVLLPTPSLVTDAPGKLVGKAGAVVEMGVDTAGDLVGEVTDVVGDVLGNGDHE
jgi:hypothetical protein